jgi:hypothetical protein
MDLGDIVLISSRLGFGAIAGFLAIMLWSKTRDVAWMLMVIGTIAAYGETVYGILERFGIADSAWLKLGSVPVIALVLPNLPSLFYSIAFAVMVARKARRR